MGSIEHAKSDGIIYLQFSFIGYIDKGMFLPLFKSRLKFMNLLLWNYKGVGITCYEGVGVTFSLNLLMI